KDFVPVNERVAVFDNDGTLWCEMPIPVQFLFAADRVKAMAPEHPEWVSTEPFKSLLAGDKKGLAAQGLKGVETIMMTAHAGMTNDEITHIGRDWVGKAKHPKLNCSYTEVVYQPMHEVLEFLRANGFSTFIVSGGGIEFMRVFADKAYGIPPYQIVGSSIKT